MDIQGALKKTGKATTEKETAGHVAIGEDEILYWFNRRSGEKLFAVKLKDVNRNDWQPYNPKPQIVPREAGELWAKCKDVYYHTVSSGHGKITMVSYAVSTDIKGVVHNKNGWTRLYSPVPDDNVEEIVIEGVMWFKNEEGVIIPYEETDGFNWKSLLNKPPMTMILKRN